MLALGLASALVAFATSPAAGLAPLDRAAERWVDRVLKKMTVDEKVAQLVVPAVAGVFTARDSDAYERLSRLARERRVGGFHVFGGGEPLPQVLLNPSYGGSGGKATKADPFGAADLLNRLQRESVVPLLVTADFEGGVGYIVNGATRLPRAMAMGATRDLALVERAGRLAAGEGRRLGVHLNFYPVVDVNNNPRNPIINVRSFGEDPSLVSQMARAYVRGLHSGGMLATAKHFPGHGDTSVDTHLDLAVIEHPRARLDAIELPPFRAAIEEGVDAVMSSHIALPALDPTPGLPATLSRPILSGLLREEMKFEGLVFTDSMSMHAISRLFAPERAAATAVAAGADVVLDPPDPEAAYRGIREAVEQGEIPLERIDRSVRRILHAKARLGLHKEREVDLAAIPAELGGRARAAVAEEVSARAVTLVKDDRRQVPLSVPAGARVLYLSVIDYASGWREGAPSRAFLPELKRRFADVTALELSDRTTAAEMDLVRALGRGADLVIASAFVRLAAYSGRMGLTPEQVSLLEELAADEKRPFVVVALGSPYLPMLAPRLPAVLLTYELTDAAEVAAARALLGDAPIGGKLPISLPGLFPVGHGLERGAGEANLHRDSEEKSR